MVYELTAKTPVIWLPTSVEEAVDLKNQFSSEGEFVSGATLLQLQWMNGRKMPNHLISLEQILALKVVKLENNFLSIGALTTLGTYQKHPLFKEYPILCDALKSIAAPAVRNRGTIGGNVMAGVGDLIPFLLAMEAKLVIHESDGSKKVDFWDWLQTKPRAANVLLEKIEIPYDINEPNSVSFYRKIGRRETFTAAILTVSGKLKWDENGVINAVKLAVGGGDNKPSRLQKTEQLLIGKIGEEIDWKALYRSINEEFIPAVDAFVSGDYRKKVAANLIVAELQSKLTIRSEREEHVYEI